MSSRGDLPVRGQPKIQYKPGFGPGGVRVDAGTDRRGRPKVEPVTPVHAMANARVVDIATFQRMRERGETAEKVARWLGVSAASARMLLDGKHWQQDPGRIALFNEYRGTNLPIEGPEMGFATPDVIAQFGGASGKRKVERTPGEQAMVDAVKRAGISPEIADEVARTVDEMAGTMRLASDRLDTAYFLEEVERKLALALASLTSTKLAEASVGDLQKVIGMFVEKRALLRGEPTQIVSHRQRVEIDKVLPMLVDAARKRGITLIDVAAREVESVDG